jgi:hypothetical protein
VPVANGPRRLHPHQTKEPVGGHDFARGDVDAHGPTYAGDRDEVPATNPQHGNWESVLTHELVRDGPPYSHGEGGLGKSQGQTVWTNPALAHGSRMGPGITSAYPGESLLITAEDARKEMTSWLGHPPNESLWETLVEEGFVDQALSVGVLDDIKQQYGVLERHERRNKRRRSDRLAGRGDSDPRDDALARILGIEARARTDVRNYRRVVLLDRLLPPEDVLEWVLKQRDRLPRHSAGADSHFAWGLGSGYLWCQSPKGVRPVVHGPRGSLKDLKRLCERLGQRYSWLEPEAVNFVLADEVPLLAEPLIELRERPEWLEEGPPWRFTREYRVRLDVPVRLSGQEVSKLYSEARKLVWSGERNRAMSAQRAELAVFIAQRNDGSTYEAVRRSWNASHPKMPYSDLNKFIKRATESYRQVTGSRLSWIGARMDLRRRS